MELVSDDVTDLEVDIEKEFEKERHNDKDFLLEKVTDADNEEPILKVDVVVAVSESDEEKESVPSKEA